MRRAKSRVAVRAGRNENASSILGATRIGDKTEEMAQVKNHVGKEGT